ncbi:MAG TPA: response regulator, partial [Methyloceanibacter sp.]|nr:response regulator [Methyloceanibacter sp.]
MGPEHYVKIAEAILIFLAALTWPGALMYVLIRFGPHIDRFLSNMSGFTIKGARLEASVSADSIAAAAAMGAAAVHQKNGNGQPKEIPEIAPLIAKATSPRQGRRLRESTVLWADDNPDNNTYERRALQALGIRIDLATDTQDALRKLDRKEYDLVISDMGRPSGEQAGYELLKAVRDAGNGVPFVIYAGSNLPQHRLEAANRGAQGSTNDPQELFE